MKNLFLRIWDKDKKKMIYFENSGFSIGSLYFTNDGFCDVGRVPGGNQLPEEVMLGAEICGVRFFEGDIIKKDIRNGVVSFEDGSFCHNGATTYPGSPYWGEVIGNIYENPELVAK